MTKEEFETERQRQSSRHHPKHYRRPDLTDESGKRWKWVNRLQCYCQVSYAPPETHTFPNSRTMCMNRNLRRKSFGYTDTYSMRERGWPWALHNGVPY